MNSNISIEQIVDDLENGLTMEQIKLYANSKFNSKQMQEIRCGLNEDLSIDEAKEKYNWASRKNNIIINKM